MAKEALRPPLATHPVAEIDRVMTLPWYRFMQLISRHLLNIAGVAAVASSDATAASPSAVSVTSADATAAGVGYVQAQAASVVTLANETKADLNTLVTDVNAIEAKVNILVTLANETKARLNEIHALLNQ